LAVIATFRVLVCAALVGGMLAGCAAKPVLLPKNPAVPLDVDLSGYWILQETSGTQPEHVAAQDRQIRIPSESAMRRTEPSRSERRSAAPSAQLFLENGSALKVSQTEHGLFISFDRSIVEEYTFGENRTVAIGPVEAQRVSGWEGPAFIIETLDEQGYLLRESWRLVDNDSALVRDLSLARRDEQKFSSRQRFIRSQP